MKILVLGGTRYFGKRLVDLLTNEGHTVTVASTGNTKAQYLNPVERLVIDRKNTSSMSTAFKNRSWDVVYDQICFNAEEAKIACEALAHKTDQLIFTSSQSVYNYGVHIEESEFDPKNYAGNPNNNNPYQEGKRLAEKTYAEQNYFSVTAVRFPIVMGPDDYTRRLHWHIARIKFGDPIFFPNPIGKLTVISSDDAAKFLNWLKSQKLAGPINACSPDPLCLKNLVETIEEILQKKMIPCLAHSPKKEEQSPYGIEKDWCAVPSKALQRGFTFSSTFSWVPTLIKQEKETSTPKDAKTHKVGFLPTL